MRGPYPTSPGIGETAPVLAPVASAAATAARGTAGPTPATRGATASPTAAAAAAGLGSAMREEVWAIVRAAVEEAMGPVVARQRELEARVERAERSGSTSAAGRPASVAPPGATGSIPVAFGPSLAPPAFAAKGAGRAPTFDAETSSGSSGGTTIPDMKAAAPYQGGAGTAAQAVRGPMLSLPPQGYGVTVMQSTRPTLDLDAVGPVNIDGFDGGRRKRRVAGAVVVIMLMIIIGAVTMTVISQS